MNPIIALVVLANFGPLYWYLVATNNSSTTRRDDDGS